MSNAPAFTPAQTRAATTLDRSLGIVAGAGSGKTSVLVERCRRLLASPGDLAHLLVITFTERAAEELRARLAAALPSAWHPQLQAAAIGTFHGCCARLIREHAPLVPCSPQVRILEAGRAGVLLTRTVRNTLLAGLDRNDLATRQLLTHSRFSTVARFMERLVDDRWNVEQTLEHGESLPPATDGIEAELLTAVTTLFRHAVTAYTAAKRAEHALDFHDLEIEALRLLEAHPMIAADYQRQFHHLLIDEMQDTNRLQWAVLERLFAPPDNTLCLVGDPKQSIYRFRGADVTCFTTALQTVAAHGGDVITLQENFRSTGAIIDFVNAACGALTAEFPLVTTRTESGTVEWLPLPAALPAAERRRVEAAAIAERIRALVCVDGRHYGEIACLSGNRHIMPALEAALRTADIPYRTHSGHGLLARPEVRDVIVLLRWAAGRRRGISDDGLLLALLRSPLFGLDLDDCYRLRWSMRPTFSCHPEERSDEGSPCSGEILRFAQDDIHNRTPLHIGAIRDPHLGPWLARWEQRLLPLTIVEWVEAALDDTQYREVLLGLDPTGQGVMNLERFLATIAELSEDRPTDWSAMMTVLDGLVEREARLPDPPLHGAHEDVVQLLTVHAAKGNEFPVVFLADLGARSPAPVTGEWGFVSGQGLALRSGTRDDDEEGADTFARWDALKAAEQDAAQAERQRLLYVALTRARDQLILPMTPAPVTPPKAPSKPRTTAPSWEEQLRETCVALGIGPRRETIPARPSAPVMRGLSSQGTVPMRQANVPISPAVHSLTVTELETFARCPEEYRLKYIERLPLSDGRWPDPTQIHEPRRGEIVHAVIQAMARHATPEYATLLPGIARQYGAAADPAALAPLHELLTAYRQLEIPTDALHEVPFVWRLPDESTGVALQIHGAIDCLFHTPHGWTLLDFKTDVVHTALDVQQQAARYQLQMRAYVLAAQQAGHAPIARAALAFLAGPHLVEVDIAPISLASQRQEMLTLARRLRANDCALPPDATPPCSRCGYFRAGLCVVSPTANPP